MSGVGGVGDACGECGVGGACDVNVVGDVGDAAQSVGRVSSDPSSAHTFDAPIADAQQHHGAATPAIATQGDGCAPLATPPCRYSLPSQPAGLNTDERIGVI